MPVYDRRQINRMKQDAIRRSQEMHSRSASNSPAPQKVPDLKKEIPEEIQKEIPEISDEPEKIITEHIEEKKKTENKIQLRQDENQISELLNEILSGSIDSDKLLVAVLILLLIKEGADIKLIIALGYILL